MKKHIATGTSGAIKFYSLSIEFRLDSNGNIKLFVELLIILQNEMEQTKFCGAVTVLNAVAYLLSS